MMYEPSRVGVSVGGAVAYSCVMLMVKERYEVVASMPPINACMR
jgi:hypothetical protein